MATITNPELAKRAIQAFDDLSGVHPGFRPTHAKGILLTGVFTPSDGGRSLSRAPHLQRSQTEVTARLSDFGGIPKVHDNDPDASPRGFALRFHLAEHEHTDIVAHSVNAFPVRTAEEFIEFLQAVRASGPDVPHPSPIEAFLGAHPAALTFVQAPKPMPASFANESFFAISAYRFTNSEGLSRFGRYRIVPDAGEKHLDTAQAAAKEPDFLFAELRERVAKAPVKFRVYVQLAEDSDTVDDATVQWPQDRPQLEFGTVELTTLAPNNEAEQQHLIFDPIPRVDGIEPSADPLLQPRADIYLMSGRRRREAEKQAADSKRATAGS